MCMYVAKGGVLLVPLKIKPLELPPKDFLPFCASFSALLFPSPPNLISDTLPFDPWHDVL